MSRVDRLRASLEEPLLVTNGVSVRYLVGFSSSNAALFVEPERVRLFSDFRYAEAARAVEGVEFVETKRSLVAALAELLEGTVGFEADAVSYASWEVLRAGGLDPAAWSGLALGVGLDRALMLRKGIADIRLLRSADPRVAGQMLDLEPYRPVSAMPPTRRDLSIGVAADLTAEELGDRIRERVEPSALEAVEELTVVAETPAAELPPPAAERIGLRPGQKNVLVRLVLRHPTRTLTAEEANRTRNAVYAAIHEGGVHQWA